jgi:hypothetical protein
VRVEIFISDCYVVMHACRSRGAGGPTLADIQPSSCYALCHILGLNGVTLSRGICSPAADDSDCLSQISFRMARLLAVTKCDQCKLHGG